MPLQALAQRVSRQYGNRITGLVGGDLNGLTVRFGDGGTSTKGNVITVDRQWWANATQRDRTGALIHEMTHVATRNNPKYSADYSGGWAASKTEQVADAVRLSLNGKYGINPATIDEARHIAQNRGWLGDNMAGPGSNLTGTRNRQTLRNNYSKLRQAPVLGPQAALALNQQLQGLQTQYSGARALAKAGIAQARGQFILARQAAQANAVQGMQGAYSDAAGRGIVGSSADLNARSAVLAQKASDVAAARNEMATGIASQRANIVQSLGDYYLGVGNIAANQAAQQAQMMVDQYQNDMLNTNLSNYNDLLRRLIRQGKPGTRQDVVRRLRSNGYNRTGRVATPGPIGPGTY